MVQNENTEQLMKNDLNIVSDESAKKINAWTSKSQEAKHTVEKI